MQTRHIAISIALLAQSLTAMAAQQCLTASGQYGTLAVSSCANDPANGIYNPMPPSLVPAGNPLADGSAFALGVTTGLLTCTFTLSHPVLTNSVRIDADVFNYISPSGDQLSVELDGNPYSFAATDIVQTPMSGAGVSQGTVMVNGGGSIVNSVGQDPSSGTMQLANNAPASFSTIKISMQADGFGTAIRLCLDDAAPVPVAATPVPATNTVTLALLSMGMAFAGFLGFRRRKQNR